MRRLLMLAIAASLLLPALFASSVVAAPQKPALAPPVTLDIQRNCQATAPRWDLTGQSNSSPGVSRSGASATINLQTPFGECLNAGFTFDDGAEAYVMLGPRSVQTDCPGSGSGRCGIQIGITDCRFTGGLGACGLGYDDPHYFYRIMGCGQTTGVVDLGGADLNNHAYTIFLDPGLVFRLQIDGVEQYSIAKSDSRISCWSSNLRKAHWEFRRKDEGDSLGDDGNETVFLDARYGVFGSGWFSPGWSTNPVNCEYIADSFWATDFCKTDNADEMRGWTTG